MKKDKRICVLDCTLRDGGYCNEWKFGFQNEIKIISGLMESGIDIIECGFLTDRIVYQKGISKFTDMEQIKQVIPKNKDGRLFVCLMNYEEYQAEELPVCDGTALDGIRVAFHKNDWEPALQVCKKIKEKGYKVFIQAMVSLNYTDEEFLSLLHQCNEIKPYAFYIVDSFGVMKQKDLMRLFYMVEHNLDENVLVGYHSHNNMQLSFSNAQMLADIQTKRTLVIDASIFGMGRGAGNLNTELFVEYCNDYLGTEYKLKPLLTVIDEVINQFYQERYWGYSLPNYLSASHNIHPNYASFLDDKKTLTIEAMDEIFSMIAPEKRSSFDEEYMKKLYFAFMEKGRIQEEHLEELKIAMNGKKVLIIAPGKSSELEKEKIISCARAENVVSISVNFAYQYLPTDYIFVSNLRRFKELEENCRSRVIATSNIQVEGVYLKTQYKKLLNSVEAVRDNAGLLLISFLIQLGVKEIWIAGMDGYSYETSKNYAQEDMELYLRPKLLEAKNAGIREVMGQYARKAEITWITAKLN